MLCNICQKNEATIHLTQIVENKTKKVDLCEGCSKEKGVDDPAGFSLADILLGLGSAPSGDASVSPTGPKCPSCGFTQADFKKGGRFGCSECYRTFQEGMESLLKTMHKGIRHTGKVPKHLQRSRDFIDQLAQLQKRLEKAVDDEDFEQAVILRDEIKQIRAFQEEAAQGAPSPQP